MAKKSINFYMEESVIEMLKVDASFEGRPMSEIVEQLVKAYVIQNKHKIKLFIQDFWK